MRFLVIFILFIFSALSFANPPCKNIFSKKFEKRSQLPERFIRSVWKLKLPDEDVATGFFISSKLFVTNLHTVNNYLHKAKSISLVHNKNRRKIKIKKIINISLVHDLALLEIEGYVKNYLKIRYDYNISQEETFFAPGYPNGKFSIVRNTGPLFAHTQYSYFFPRDRIALDGGSGSPLLNKKGQVIGVITESRGDVTTNVSRIDNLKELFNETEEKSELDLEKAFENLQERAIDEDNLAFQNLVAGIYSEGYYGIPINHKKALRWLNRAAKRGDTASQEDLALLLFYGTGIPRDLVKAFKWYKVAAERGGYKAPNQLADMYFDGWGTPKKHAEAFKWYKIAAERGETESQTALANMYYKGQGVSKNYKKAFTWYKKAAENGDPTSQTALANMYYRGQGVSKNYEKAIEWYERATDSNFTPALYKLANIYQEEGELQDMEKAIQYYEKIIEIEELLTEYSDSVK